MGWSEYTANARVSIPANHGGSMSARFSANDRIVVLGEGLAAGVGHFSLSEETQPWSFPALVARQLGVNFHQPILQAPGLGNTHHRQLAPIVPDVHQTTVRVDLNGTERPLDNLAIPGLTARDAITLRPRSPLVHRDDAKQTLINFILGLPGLAERGVALPTALEAAQARQPTFALVELGYYELLETCVKGYLHSGERMELASFESDYDQILGALSGIETVVVATIPDPLDTAYFSSLTTAARILRTEVRFLQEQYGLAADDRITVPGLMDIGFQLTARQVTGTIEAGGVLSAEHATRLCRAAARLNTIVRRTAESRNAHVYDLGAFIRTFAREGAVVGGRRLTNAFLDGFYLLNGVYPGRTGHALIANDVIAFLNREFGTLVDPVVVSEVMSDDGNTLAVLSPGAPATDAFLAPRTRAEMPRVPPPDPSLINVFPPFDPDKFNLFPIQTIYPELDPKGTKLGCEPAKGIPAGGMSQPRLAQPLKLPPGLEQTLPLNKDWRYFGDALRAVDATHDKPF